MSNEDCSCNRSSVSDIGVSALSALFVLVCVFLFRLIDPTRAGIPDWCAIVIICSFFLVPAVVGGWAVLQAVHSIRLAGSRGTQNYPRSTKWLTWGAIVLGVITFVSPVIVLFAPWLVSHVAREHRLSNNELTDVAFKERWESEITPASAQDVNIGIQPVAMEEIISEANKFSEGQANTEEDRKSFCVELFRQSGYEPTISDYGDIMAVKEGRSSDYVAIGAHYDKVEGPSEGILDNMLGCIIVCNLAEAFRDVPTEFTYLFLCYREEELGRKIGSATTGYRSGVDGRPIHTIEVDYVGGKRAELRGRYLSPFGGRFVETGIKITSVNMPTPPTIHTERDNISNVDFDKAYLAYKTMISLVEGIERGHGLNPPDTVHFWRKDKPLRGTITAPQSQK